jgi:predicted RecB family endonuclease
MKQDLSKLTSKQVTSQGRSSGSELVNLLTDSISRFSNIDDLYVFFDKTLRDLKINLSTLQFNNVVVQFDCGSVIEMFIKRCIFSATTMMFEDLLKLFNSFIAYRNGEEYEYKQSKIQLDYWAA